MPMTATPLKAGVEGDIPFSLVLPAYNESEGIEEVLLQCYEDLKEITSQFEIIVVNDGSEDNTADIVAEMEKKYPPVHLISYYPNCGYAEALKRGFQRTTKPWVGYTDSDGQFRVKDFQKLLEKRNPKRMVVGYRLHRQDPFLRKLASWGYGVIFRALFSIPARDVNCAMKLFPGEVIRRWELRSQNFLIDAEFFLLARRENLEVMEVPVSHYPRQKGQSTIQWNTIGQTLRDLYALWRVYRNLS